MLSRLLHTLPASSLPHGDVLSVLLEPRRGGFGILNAEALQRLMHRHRVDARVCRRAPWRARRPDA